MARLISLLAALVLSSAPAWGGTLIVANAGDASVSLFDPETGAELATLPVGAGPGEVAVSGDGTLAVVSCRGTREAPGSTLSVIDLGTVEVVNTIELGGHTLPGGVEIFDDNRTLLVTVEGSESVLWVDAQSGEILTTLKTDQKGGARVALTPQQRRAFVPNSGSGTVTTIDTEPRSPSRTVVPGRDGRDSEPAGAAVSPDGRRVWVTNRKENTFAIFDARSLRSVNTKDCAGGPERVLFTPDGQFALIGCVGSGEVAVLNWRKAEELSRLGLGGAAPVWMACSGDGRWLFASGPGGEGVTVVDLGALKIEKTIETRGDAAGLGWTDLDVARDAG